ncbi:tRNA pseudouridine(13) synthase TruD [Calycomorphotria hydatis]|uniref:tRNA pseudouridine synthase D n=1 Tax=Calycomorphotria hydatis TaxID=2528027 RepID=A0A517T6D1_9PLAN|nr:tRNA pseudouridine(13) synthase TruD [Calycomorphotria hydatis]QDT63908.1 tRNA pseudouridine synthase D [Calycomorphotria hydatis]
MSELLPNFEELYQSVVNPPRFTSETGLMTGKLKVEPEDFVVEEIPAYEPSGEGEHLYLWVEKRNCSAEQFTSQLARMLQTRKSDIGTAGMKDRRAVTRQYVSVPAECEDRWQDAHDENIQILSATHHTNKLRTGHLWGNRFEIAIRDVHGGDEATFQDRFEKIRRSGFPNYFGSQRYGDRGSTLELGINLLNGNRTPKSIPFARRRFLLRLALSAVQSAIFNLVVVERLRAGTLEEVKLGDIMQVAPSGGSFEVLSIEEEQPRLLAGETLLTGPMPGPKMRQPTGEPGKWEQLAMNRLEIQPEQFRQFAKLAPGTRRPMLTCPQDFSVDKNDDRLVFHFTLPAGSYATVLLREFFADLEN